MGQVRYLDGAWYQFIERQTGNRTDGTVDSTPGVGKICFQRLWVYEPIDIDGLAMEYDGGVPTTYLAGIYGTNLSTGLPTGSPLYQAPSHTAVGTELLRTLTRGSIPSGALWGAFTQLAAGRFTTARNNTPPVDMGVDLSAPTARPGFFSWITPWVYNAAGLPDVTAFTFIGGTTVVTVTPPQMRWRTRR